MPRRLARPVYEALPLLWALAGAACLGGSYLAREHGASGLLALAGLVLLVLALAVWMHRRDYRATAADYQLRGGDLPVPGGAPADAPAARSEAPGEGMPPPAV